MRNLFKPIAIARVRALATLVTCAACALMPTAEVHAQETAPQPTPAAQATPEPQTEAPTRQAPSRRRSRRNNNVIGDNPFATFSRSTGLQNAPARARPQARSVISRERRSVTGRGTAGEFPRLEISASIHSHTLYFSDPDISIETQSQFSTGLVFFNADSTPVDRIELWIHYEPDVLEPMWVDTEGLDFFLAEPIEREVWPETGYIRLSAKFSTPLVRSYQALVTLGWKASDEPARGVIGLDAPPGEATGIYAGSTNLLKLSRIGNAGLVEASVTILSEPDPLDSGRAFVVTNEDPYRPGSAGGVHLGIIARSARVRAGEVSTLDVVLINPNAAAFDQLKFRIRYDPKAVDILDADENNYITKGVNIYDGGFHETMPFEYHVVNEVYPSQGVIEYEVGSLQGLKPYPSGTVARIVFRPRHDAGSAFFWFEGVDPLTARLRSDVRARGRSLIGDGGDRPQDSLHHVRVRVSPL